HQSYQVECVGYDQDAPATYEQLASLAAARIEQAGRGPAVVLAESFGGALAPIPAPAPPAPVHPPLPGTTLAHFPPPPPPRLRVNLPAWLGRFFPAKPSPAYSRPLRGVFFFAPDVPSAERAEWWERTGDVPMRAFGHRLKMIRDLDLRPRLREVSAPCVVV